MSSGGNSSSGGSKKQEQSRSGGYTKNNTFAWGSKGKDSSTYIDSSGWKRNTSDNSRTYEYPPRKYNSDGTVKGSN